MMVIIMFLINIFVGSAISGSVVECLTRDGGVAGSSLTGITALTHQSSLSTGSTREDPSRLNWKQTPYLLHLNRSLDSLPKMRFYFY